MIGSKDHIFQSGLGEFDGELWPLVTKADWSVSEAVSEALDRIGSRHTAAWMLENGLWYADSTGATQQTIVALGDAQLAPAFGLSA